MKLYILTAFLVFASQSLKAGEEDRFYKLVIHPKLLKEEITLREATELSKEVAKVRAELFSDNSSNKNLSTEIIETFWRVVDKLSPPSSSK